MFNHEFLFFVLPTDFTKNTNLFSLSPDESDEPDGWRNVLFLSTDYTNYTDLILCLLCFLLFVYPYLVHLVYLVIILKLSSCSSCSPLATTLTMSAVSHTFFVPLLAESSRCFSVT